MSTYIYTGASGWGKSFFVMNRVMPKIKKAIIFDPSESFTGDYIIKNGTAKEFETAYMKFKDSPSFKIVVRVDSTGSDLVLFNKTVELARAIGRVIKLRSGKVEEPERIQVVIDEATTSGIVSSHHYPKLLQYLVCKGRHDNLDSHIIAQNPMAIHSQIRELCTKITTFFLKSGSAPILQESFTPEMAKKIPELKRFWRMEATAGTVEVFDEKNSMIFQQNFGQKNPFPSKIARKSHENLTKVED